MFPTYDRAVGAHRLREADNTPRESSGKKTNSTHSNTSPIPPENAKTYGNQPLAGVRPSR
jgi:hypothetical protein